MTKNNVIIRFVQSAEQSIGNIKRIVGFVPAKHILPLFQEYILDANPRKPRVGRVTADIIDSLEDTPELFQFKSKGLLVGTSQYKVLQRNRYKLDFKRPGAEGVLDGGHNMLAIGLHILEQFMDEKEWRKIKTWDDLLKIWGEYVTKIKRERDELDFFVPVELLVPVSDTPLVIEEFRIAMIDICAARNNNAQLAQEAKANQRGFYDDIRCRFENKLPNLAKRVEWKTNEWEEGKKPIKVRDLVSLAWIPLSVLDENQALPEQFSLSPQLIYSSKAKLSEQFDKLMANKKVTKQVKTGKYELYNLSITSAFDVLCDLPNLVDWIILHLPAAYNKVGRFGAIDAVKKRKTHTPYFLEEMDYRVPDGFVMPLVYGLKALMTVVNGKVQWKTDPQNFLEQYFEEIVKGFKMPMDMAGLDPQKVGKNVGSYDFCVKQYQFAMQG